MQIYNYGSYDASISIDGFNMYIPRGNTQNYTPIVNTYTSSSNPKRNRLEQLREEILNEVKQKATELKEHELAPSDMKDGMQKEIDKLYSQAQVILKSMESFP